jgi:hypothetical protein
MADIEEYLRRHIEEYHAFRKAELEGMVEEHREIVAWIEQISPTIKETNQMIKETNRNVNLIVDDLYGDLHPTAADPDHREGGLAATLQRIEDTVDSAIHLGVTTKREWTQGQWAFAGAVLTAIAAFVIRGWFG